MKAYSILDEERFDHSLHDEIDAYFSQCVNEDWPVTITVRVGDGKPKPLSYFLDADYLIELAQERAGEDCGDFVDGWLDNVTPEQKAELSGFINAWAALHDLQPEFYAVEKVKERRLVVLNDKYEHKWEEMGRMNPKPRPCNCDHAHRFGRTFCCDSAKLEFAKTHDLATGKPLTTNRTNEHR